MKMTLLILHWLYPIFEGMVIGLLAMVLHNAAMCLLRLRWA